MFALEEWAAGGAAAAAPPQQPAPPESLRCAPFAHGLCNEPRKAGSRARVQAVWAARGGTKLRGGLACRGLSWAVLAGWPCAMQALELLCAADAPAWAASTGRHPRRFGWSDVVAADTTACPWWKTARPSPALPELLSCRSVPAGLSEAAPNCKRSPFRAHAPRPAGCGDPG